MANIGDLVVRLEALTTRFESKMLSSTRSVRTFESATSASIAHVRGLFATLGIGLGFAGIGLGVKKLIDASEGAWTAQTKLRSVLTATGYAAGYSATELIAFSSQLQRTTNFEDDAITNAQALLATFRNIGPQAFKPAALAALDLSAVLGTDLNAAMIMLGKALNNPSVGLVALRRAGVSFTESQLDMIRSLQASGDLLGAQGIILRELSNEFGGAAAAMVNPATQFKNAVGDLAETVGGALTPYMRIATQGLTNWTVRANDGTAANSGLVVSLGAVADVLQKLPSLWDYAVSGLVRWQQFAAQGMASFLSQSTRPDLQQQGEFFRLYSDELRKQADRIEKGAGKQWDAQRLSQRAAELAAQLAKAGENARGVRTALTDIDEALDNVGGEGANPLGDFIDELQNKLATFDMSPVEVQLMRIRQLARDPIEIGWAEDLVNKLRGMEKEKSIQALGKRITEQFQDPLEKFRGQIAHLKTLEKAGAITPQTSAAAQAVYRSQAAGAIAQGQPGGQGRAVGGDGRRLAGAAEMGSTAAWSSILASMGYGQKNEGPTAEGQEETNKMLAEIVQNTAPREGALDIP